MPPQKRPAMAAKTEKEKADEKEEAEPPVNPPEGDQNTKEGEGTEDEREKTPDPNCPFAQFAAGEIPDPDAEEGPALKKPAIWTGPQTKGKGKAKPKATPKDKGVKKDKKDKKDNKDKDKKDKEKKGKKDKNTPEEETNTGEPQKKEKKTLKKQTDEWTKALDADKAPDEKNDDEEEFDPNEVRDRQKAQKYAKLEKEGALPKEVTDAMEAASKSANPRAAKTQLINRLFRKEGKGFVMIPKDPAFQKIQRHLDVKFGKEQATSHLAYKIQTWLEHRCYF